MKSARGFTLVELVIYVGLTAMTIALFGAILVTILRVQGEQNASSQVSSELNSLMTTLKRHIHEASTVPVVGPYQIDFLKNPSEGLFQTFIITYNPIAKNITINDGAVGTTEQVSSDRTRIDDLLFEKLQDPVNASSVLIRITITASASTTDPSRQSTRTLQTTAAPFKLSQ